MEIDQASDTANNSGRITPELWWLSAIMAFGGFASLLDATVINIAIGPLTAVFDAELSTVQWTVTGYLLAITATLPLSGWAMTRFGAKQTLIFSQAAFLIGSLLAGLAWSAPSLIAFRVIQGIGGGLAVPVGQALLAQAAGPGRLGRLMSVVTVPALVAPLIGPSLGGIMVDSLSWRWIFFINVPFCIVSIALMAAKVRNVVTPSAETELDVVGMALLMPGLAALVYGLSEAGSAGGFGNDRVIGGLTVGAVLLATFALRAMQSKREPLLDLRLLGIRSFRSGTLANVLLSVAMYGVMIPLPMYFQVVRGTSVLTSALLMLPQSAGFLVIVISLNRISALLGSRTVTLLGLLLVMVGTVPFTVITADPNQFVVGAALCIRGIGLGATMIPTMTVAFSSVPKSAAASATSAFNVFQRVGASVGTAVLAVVLQKQVAGRLPDGTSTLAQVTPGSDTARDLATAFHLPFLWALAFTAFAVVPSFLLPGRQTATTQSPTPAQPDPAM